MKKAMTLAQFETDWRETYLRENPEVIRAEYFEDYPPGYRKEEWRKHLHEMAQDGIVFPKAVCRDVVKQFNADALKFIAKYWPSAIPDGISTNTGKVIQKEWSKKGFISAPTLEQLKPTAEEKRKLQILWEWQEQSAKSKYMLP